MRFLIPAVIVCLTGLSFADDITIDLATASPGARINLDGRWLYKPGFAIAAGEHPETPAPETGYLPIPVPAFLNRIRWWLDDSKDFDTFETARLKSLGFETEKAEDGWYHQWITLDKLPAGRHLFIEFDGVAMTCELFCNGKSVGSHAGMFSRFSFDLTPHLKPGRNLLAIHVSMEKAVTGNVPMGNAVTVNLTASKVLTMSKGMFGPLSPGEPNRNYDLHGIWQPVHLVVRGEGRIDDVWFRSSDIFQNSTAIVDLDSNVEEEVQVEARYTDLLTAQTIASIGQTFKGKGHQTISLGPLHGDSVHVKTWTPANPNLYRLDVTMKKRTGQVLDSWSHRVGFRAFEVKGNQLFLNGHPYWLRGANQLPYGKNPFDDALPRKLIQLLHDNNIRATRTHATPWNEAWLDAADEIGLGMSIEGIRPWALVGKIGPCPPEMFKLWLDENADVVKRCRNHPSVLIWTVGNEMMLRDPENLEKWKQLSDVVKQTRELDPTRPVVCSSTYAQEEKLYDKLLKPNHFDDGDLDDVHYYRGWYAASPFVTDSLFEKEFKARGSLPPRPLIGQEMSTGYPDLDTGLPVARYTNDLLTPQAWVGNYAYPGSDPKIFLDHIAQVTQRWAEQLRFQRGDRTAGFMLFSTECWFSHSYDSQLVHPYPVLNAVKQAFAPVGLALESGRYRFYAGEKFKTAVFATNDDESFRDLEDVKLDIRFNNPPKSGDPAFRSDAMSLRYYETKRIPLEFQMLGTTEPREHRELVISVVKDDTVIGSTIHSVEIFQRPPPLTGFPVHQQNLGPEMKAFLSSTKQIESSVSILGPGSDLADVDSLAQSGRTVVLLSPGKSLVGKYPDSLLDYKDDIGEYADCSPVAGTPLATNLEPMDLKWWARKDDWRCFVLSGSHRLKPGGKARDLIHFIPSHGYIAADKVPQQHRSAMFEIPADKGRVWVCDLDLETSVNVDPAAAIFATNLLRAAADPHSTDHLPQKN